MLRLLAETWAQEDAPPETKFKCPLSSFEPLLWPKGYTRNTYLSDFTVSQLWHDMQRYHWRTHWWQPLVL